MLIATALNRNSPPAIVLRESYRENGKVKSRTLANLTMLPEHVIEVLRQSLKGEQLVALSRGLRPFHEWVDQPIAHSYGSFDTLVPRPVALIHRRRSLLFPALYRRIQTALGLLVFSPAFGMKVP